MGRPAKPPADTPLARTVREHRQLLGLTLSQLGEQVGVTGGYISRIERGERKRLHRDTAIRLAQALGLDPLRMQKLAGILDDADLERYARVDGVVKAIMDDRRLTAEQQRILIATYRSYLPPSSSRAS